MKTIYYVADRRTNKEIFRSTKKEDCYKYVDENNCFSSTIVRKKTVYKTEE